MRRVRGLHNGEDLAVMKPFMKRVVRLGLGLCWLSLVLAGWTEPSMDSYEIVSVSDVSPVWSGHAVSFSMLRHADYVIIGFYDAERNMTIGLRKDGTADWKLTRLASKIGWDSHNYIAIAVDDNEDIHVSGNMHVNPLVYFRTKRPLDIDSFERVPAMTGEREIRMTYPGFFRGPKNEFIFSYRDGGSGNGDTLLNVYEHGSRTWRRLMDQPLFAGNGQMNAYAAGPLKGPDGRFYAAWVWRNTSACETNHDLSYGVTQDLVHWETSTGSLVRLPITVATGEIVDPIPVRGGLTNSQALGFDSKGRPVISYQKYDARGKSQIFNARLEQQGWNIRQSSEWDYRWEFSGSGTVVPLVHAGAVSRGKPGELKQTIKYPGHDGTWVLDENTLKLVRPIPGEAPLPKEVTNVTSPFPGMQSHTVRCAGPDTSTVLVMRWETLASNRDKPRKPPLPAPSMLKIYTLRQSKSQAGPAPAKQ